MISLSRRSFLKGVAAIAFGSIVPLREGEPLVAQPEWLGFDLSGTIVPEELFTMHQISCGSMQWFARPAYELIFPKGLPLLIEQRENEVEIFRGDRRSLIRLPFKSWDDDELAHIEGNIQRGGIWVPYHWDGSRVTSIERPL